MAGTSRNPDRDRPLDFKGLLDNLQDWDHSYREKERKSKGSAAPRGKKSGTLRDAGKVDEDRGHPKKVHTIGVNENNHAISEVPHPDCAGPQVHLKYPESIRQISSRFLSEEKAPDAASEKELGNEYFKQKKFLEAIECYSRSIALSPTAVAFANRAMAYLKIKRFEEAESDCTEALLLDDRYVKAYSRRATARKELGKLKSSMEDSDFAMRLEPNNQELRKQYTETKALYEKEIILKTSAVPKTSTRGIQEVGISEVGSKDVKGVYSASTNNKRPVAPAVRPSNAVPSERNLGQPLVAIENIDARSTAVGNRSRETAAVSLNDESAKDLASRAASRVMAMASYIAPPKSAYEFEVSWRALSDDCALQTNLLKTIPPATLPGIFKNALSAPMLVDIVKCAATFFREDTEFAVSILDNLAKVPRFDMIVMCLSAVDRSGLLQIWEEVLSSKDIPSGHVETLRRLRPKYCYGGWQV